MAPHDSPAPARTAATQRDLLSSLRFILQLPRYSKVQQPWKQLLGVVFSRSFPLQRRSSSARSAATLHLPPTTSNLPSSGPAEAPSEPIPCSSPGSELLSWPPDWAPSVRHPLEFELGKEFRRNTKPHVRNSALTQLWKQSLLVPH